MPKVNEEQQDQVNTGTEHLGVPSAETKPTSKLNAAPSFTPGPWFNNAGVSIDGVKGKTIVWLDEDTTEGDTALIIAAPKLYEALKKTLTFGRLNNDARTFVLAALALADGQVTSDESGTTTER